MKGLKTKSSEEMEMFIKCRENMIIISKMLKICHVEGSLDFVAQARTQMGDTF